MPKTKNDIIVGALQHLGVVSGGEPAQPEEVSHADKILDGVFDEMELVHELNLGTLAAVDDAVFVPLYRLLAVELGPHYATATESRSRAVMRLRQAAIPPEIDTTVKAQYF